MSPSSPKHRRRLWAAIGGVALGVAIVAAFVLAIAAIDRANLIRSCNRVNALRAEVNDIGIRVVRPVLKRAAANSFASGDTATAELYRAYAGRVDRIVIPDCHDTVPLVPGTGDDGDGTTLLDLPPPKIPGLELGR